MDRGLRSHMAVSILSGFLEFLSEHVHDTHVLVTRTIYYIFPMESETVPRTLFHEASLACN